MNPFGTINAIYGEYFKTAPPGRVCGEVARRPKDVQIKIETVALAS